MVKYGVPFYPFVFLYLKMMQVHLWNHAVHAIVILELAQIELIMIYESVLNHTLLITVMIFMNRILIFVGSSTEHVQMIAHFLTSRAGEVSVVVKVAILAKWLAGMTEMLV